MKQSNTPMTHHSDLGTDRQMTLFAMTEPAPKREAKQHIAADEPTQLPGVPFSQYYQARLREFELGLADECPF